MKKVLVTGASGFIGRHCLPILQTRGYEIHAVSSRLTSGKRSGIHWHRADLLNADESPRLLRAVEPTHLLHLAWCTAPGSYWNSPDNSHWVQASLELFQSFADNCGERIVAAGTCAEYDWKDGICSERTTALAPTSLYGVSKHALRLRLEACARENNFRAAWARIFFVYGPHEHSDRLIPSVICSLLRNEPARCSTGEQRRDFLFAEDAASALVALLDSEVCGPVNIASGEGVAVNKVVCQIAQQLNRLPLVQLGTVPVAPEGPPLLVADVQRLQQEVGWKPRFDLKQGLELSIEWWREAGLDK